MDMHAVFLKLDKMANDIADLRVDSAKSIVILDRNTKDVQTHISRTDLLESKLELLTQELARTDAKWKGALWAATAIFGAITTLSGLLVHLLH